jgi:CBS domain containing-hemolysin-like protein
MANFIWFLVLSALTWLAIAWQKTYHHVPTKELKRRAQKGDETAKMLYKAVAYGASLDVLLWVIIGLTTAGLFVVLNNVFHGFVAVLACAGVVWLGFVWLPTAKVTSVSQKLTTLATPSVAWLLRYIYPMISYLGQKLSKLRPVTVHTGLYQKEDLIDLIKQQRVQADNRVAIEELRIATHALSYGDKVIRDFMTPRRVVKMANANDTIGPILMTELHGSGHSRFPVYDGSKDKLVGTLYAKDLVLAKTGGKVANVMRGDVYYVNEEASLDHALQAFLKTKHHLFMVINEFEEVVGIITIEDVLEQILGKKIMDEFDKYDDMRAVAHLHAKEDHKDMVGEIIE